MAAFSFSTTTTTPAQSAQDICTAFNAACRSRGGVYAQYSCKSVSWDDVSRGGNGSSLSCWGANITDTRLYEKSGVRLYTVRSDNWNEKLGRVDANEIALVQGNHEKPSSNGGAPPPLSPVTLADFLKNIGVRAEYVGMDRTTNLSDETLDRSVSIRFQTTFLPVADAQEAAVEFCSEAYNYNTLSDNDPRNLILLCTTQGVAVQQDGSGAQKLFHHAVDTSGTVHRYWLEAERSRHKVGGAQVETQVEAQAAAARGKATSSVIGIEAMGTRFNALLTIQVPLQQKPKPRKKISSNDLANASPVAPATASPELSPAAATPPTPTTSVPEPDMPEFKVLLVGDAGVGKTTFLRRHLTGELETCYRPTKDGAEVNPLTFYTSYGPVRFQVWDVAGRNSTLREAYYAGADAALILFDTTTPSNHADAGVARWHREASRDSPDLPILVCGTKTDARNQKQHVTFHRRKQLPFCELSSVSNHNMEAPFLWLARKLTNRPDLVFVEAPALCPPEASIDEATKTQYEAELAAAAAQPLPEDDDDEDDLGGWGTPFCAPPKQGTANAARVSQGSEVMGPAWGGLRVRAPKRDPNQHVTVTVVLYNTVAGGVPSVDDCKAAIDDMERLYAACQWKGRLAEDGANFMKAPLTHEDCQGIATKLLTQPYVPGGSVVQNATVFPQSQST